MKIHLLGRWGVVFVPLLIVCVVICFNVVRLKQVEASLEPKPGQMFGRPQLTAGEDPTDRIAQLTMDISVCRSPVNNLFASQKSTDLLVRLLVERMQLYQRALSYDLALRDIDAIATLNKKAGYSHGYTAAVCWKSELLYLNGQWHEAVQACQDLIEEIGENTSYRPYCQLVYLCKHPPEAEQVAPELIDAYRQKALLIAKGDWRER